MASSAPHGFTPLAGGRMPHLYGLVVESTLQLLSAGSPQPPSPGAVRHPFPQALRFTHKSFIIFYIWIINRLHDFFFFSVFKSGRFSSEENCDV
jgi:hypothetical protein